MKDKEIEEMIIEESCSTIRGQISSGSWNAQQKKERIQKIVESALTTQKESFIKIIESKKSGQEIDNGHDCYDYNCKYCENLIKDQALDDIKAELTIDKGI